MRHSVFCFFFVNVVLLIALGGHFEVLLLEDNVRSSTLMHPFNSFFVRMSFPRSFKGKQSALGPR